MSHARAEVKHQHARTKMKQQHASFEDVCRRFAIADRPCYSFAISDRPYDFAHETAQYLLTIAWLYDACVSTSVENGLYASSDVGASTGVGTREKCVFSVGGRTPL